MGAKANKSEKCVPLMLSVPPEYLVKLRKMAAERNFQNPQRVTSAAAIAREIILEELSKLQQEV